VATDPLEWLEGQHAELPMFTREETEEMIRLNMAAIARLERRAARRRTATTVLFASTALLGVLALATAVLAFGATLLGQPLASAVCCTLLVVGLIELVRHRRR
jgi:Flp pilus assembly protein TadB